MINYALDSTICKAWAYFLQLGALRAHSVGEVQVQARTELPSALSVQSHGLIYGPIISPVASDFMTMETVAK